ncbi:MAG: hypothetical protein AABX99_01050 [Nanoarchaeota archaeon]
MVKRGNGKTYSDKEKMKKLFFTFLDAIILLSFGLSVYFTLIQDYMRTILFMVFGTLFLMFFIVRGILRVHFKKFDI